MLSLHEQNLNLALGLLSGKVKGTLDQIVVVTKSQNVSYFVNVKVCWVLKELTTNVNAKISSLDFGGSPKSRFPTSDVCFLD